MKKLLFLIIIISFISCQKNNVELNILNSPSAINDSVKIELKNNTDNDYLFYVKRRKISYLPSSKNILMAEIVQDDKPVEVMVSSDPLFIPYEDGSFDPEVIEIKKSFKSSDSGIIKIVPAKSSFVFNVKLLYSLNDNGGEEYPFLNMNKYYNLTLKIDFDSSSVDKKRLKRSYNEDKAKIFHGILVSKTKQIK